LSKKTSELNSLAELAEEFKNNNNASSSSNISNQEYPKLKLNHGTQFL